MPGRESWYHRCRPNPLQPVWVCVAQRVVLDIRKRVNPTLKPQRIRLGKTIPLHTTFLFSKINRLRTAFETAIQVTPNLLIVKNQALSAVLLGSVRCQADLCVMEWD